MFESSEPLKPWPFKALKKPWYEGWPFPSVTGEGKTVFTAQKYGWVYRTRAIKYPWAPDTYLAFPIVYFHYELDGPSTRHILMHPAFGRGSGPVETQISVSRDGVNWNRFTRPTYVGLGHHEGRNVYTAYLAHGMVRRGDEIWQYYFGESQYHSAHKKDEAGRAVYRLVQRLDGFISMDAPYDKEVTVVSKPLVFKGNRLLLNIDTDAAGPAFRHRMR